MKNYTDTTRSIVILLIAIDLIFTSCNKKHDCQYDDMTYNKNDKRCECIQPYASSEIPALSNSEYNTCEAVVRNFIYFSVDITRKCYVKGILSFGSQSAVIPWVSITEPSTCHSADILFDVIDIHNE